MASGIFKARSHSKRFQSLKGFQRFCGSGVLGGNDLEVIVSIPKRVSEVLWRAPV